MGGGVREGMEGKRKKGGRRGGEEVGGRRICVENSSFFPEVEVVLTLHTRQDTLYISVSGNDLEYFCLLLEKKKSR